MRKHLKLTLALGAMVALSVAGIAMAAGSSEEVTVGTLNFKAGGQFSPKTLSKTKQTPISLMAEGHISTTDGSHPPALKEALIETDKNGEINVKGLPVCKSGQLQSRDTNAAKAACKTALIGEGTTTAEVEFAEQKPIDVKSKLLVFNGGFSGGTTTLYIHAYFSAPVSGAIVTTVKIKKIHNGRYGLLSTASIPKIAGGFGSITDFVLKLNKGIKYKGKTYNPLTAKCADGKLQAHATAVFADGTKASTEFIRTCTGK